MIFLFDTDVLIDILRNREETIRQVEEWTYKADILACSVVTVAEIFAGLRKGEEKKTRELLESLTKLTVTEEAAERAGEFKKETKSHQLYLDDCMIAATALVNDAVLFTKNVKHYPFKALKLERIR